MWSRNQICHELSLFILLNGYFRILVEYFSHLYCYKLKFRFSQFGQVWHPLYFYYLHWNKQEHYLIFRLHLNSYYALLLKLFPNDFMKVVTQLPIRACKFHVRNVVDIRRKNGCYVSTANNLLILYALFSALLCFSTQSLH